MVNLCDFTESAESSTKNLRSFFQQVQTPTAKLSFRDSLDQEEIKGKTLAERLYECMFLLDSGRYAQDPQGTEKIVQEILERCEAELVVSTPWQEGKLAYEIDGHRKGLHYLTYFKMDASQVTAFTRICKLNEVVIRQLLLDHDEKLFSLLTQQVQPPESEDSEEEPVAVGAGAQNSGTDDADSTEDDE